MYRGSDLTETLFVKLCVIFACWPLHDFTVFSKHRFEKLFNDGGIIKFIIATWECIFFTLMWESEITSFQENEHFEKNYRWGEKEI